MQAHINGNNTCKPILSARHVPAVEEVCFSCPIASVTNSATFLCVTDTGLQN